MEEAKHGKIDERVRQIEWEILNAFTVERQTSLADGAGPPGAAAIGNEGAGHPDADADRGRRD